MADARRLAERLVEAWNSHDLEQMAALYTHDYEGRDVGEAEPQIGPNGICQSLTRYLTGFPDLYFTLERTIVEGDSLAVEWLARGTHTGTLLNIPPTGRCVMVQGVSMLTLRDGQVERGLYVWDVAGLLRDIRLLPELTPEDARR